jgi:hypothetical protein
MSYLRFRNLAHKTAEEIEQIIKSTYSDSDDGAATSKDRMLGIKCISYLQQRWQ